jgi:hypothetical protein
MKTLLSFLTTFALISGIASLDAHHWDANILFPALAVATLAAFALADGPRPARRALSARFGASHSPSLKPAA